jgi:sarcosine oxidase
VLASIDQNDLRHERLDAEEFRARYPQHGIQDGEVAVLDLDAGFLRPDIALVAAARRAEELGGVIERYRRVESVVAEGDRVVVAVDGDERRFRKVVVAAGGWTGKLLPEVGPFLSVKRPTQAWFAARDPARFRPDDNPPVLRSTGVPGAYVLPSVDGVAVKMGLGQENHEPVDDPDRLNRSFTADQIQQYKEVASQILPGVFPDPIRLGAYVDAYTPDGHAMVGVLPGQENVVPLCGFSGHGFKLAPVFGDIAADLVTAGETGRAIEHVAPARYLA